MRCVVSKWGWYPDLRTRADDRCGSLRKYDLLAYDAAYRIRRRRRRHGRSRFLITVITTATHVDVLVWPWSTHALQHREWLREAHDRPFE